VLATTDLYEAELLSCGFDPITTEAW